MAQQFSSSVPLGYLIGEVGRLFKRRFEEETRGQGITLPQWKVLAEIMRNEGVAQRALAAAIDADPMTMSGILDRLEKRGLIERYPDPKDSRAKLARVTKEGVKVVETARAAGLAIYDRAIAGVSAAEQKQLMEALTRIRDNLNGMTAEQKESA
jgi:MarR family transcriptional regulator for hemolysin